MDTQNRIKTLLSIFLGAIEVVCGLFILWYLIGPKHYFSDLVIFCLTEIGLLALHFLLRRGHISLVSKILPLGLWGMITTALISYGTIRDVSITAYFFILVLTALVIGEGGITFFGGLILVTVAGIYLAELNGVIYPIRNELDLYDLIAFSLILSISIFLLRAAVREINRGFSHAYDRERELDALNAKLEQLVQERTLQWETSNQELTKIKNRLQFLISSNPAVIYSARIGGQIGTTYVSDNVEKQLGYSAEEFLGDPEFWLNHIHPEDKPLITSQFQRLYEEGHRIFEYRFHHRDGHYLWIRDEAKLTRSQGEQSDELVGSWIDITARKQ
ncbi:MAG TPA: PAS domain-containing protein, partial [Anaerolineales bacterium]|nr:PAS domain-containing protein [Anaerolineales bacterium]